MLYKKLVKLYILWLFKNKLFVQADEIERGGPGQLWAAAGRWLGTVELTSKWVGGPDVASTEVQNPIPSPVTIQTLLLQPI
jgi:hypothetical protein